MRLKAYAKINWLLDIVGVKDGYHMLDGVMETISLCDVIDLEIREDEKINTHYEGVAAMKGDLCMEAAKLFFEKTSIKGGADIYVKKQIPMEAGLGGGSSDAAQVLMGLNLHYGLPLSETELFWCAEMLGADVPFFINGGAQRARGKGEILNPIERNEDINIIVVKPKGEGVSTAQAFKLYDAYPDYGNGNVEGMICALSKGDISEIGRYMYNALEVPSQLLLPEIEVVKNKLICAGAKSAIMTGSGSAVIGLLGNDTVDTDILKDAWYTFCKTVKADDYINANKGSK